MLLDCESSLLSVSLQTDRGLKEELVLPDLGKGPRCSARLSGQLCVTLLAEG